MKIWNNCKKNPGEFFVMLNYFLTIYPPLFKKMKKTPVDIIILHMCNINDNHMMYGS